jgi:hypothetical protein
MLNALGLVGIVVVSLLILKFWARMNLRYAVAEESASNKGARYVEPIRLAIKRADSLPYLSVGNGINAIVLVVEDRSVRVKLRGTAGKLAGRFALGLGKGVWDGSEITMSHERVEWNAEPFNSSRESVVLDMKKGERHVKLAVVPLDGDFERLRSALGDAGVQA